MQAVCLSTHTVPFEMTNAWSLNLHAWSFHLNCRSDTCFVPSSLKSCTTWDVLFTKLYDTDIHSTYTISNLVSRRLSKPSSRVSVFFRCYSGIYDVIIKDCKANGKLDPTKIGAMFCRFGWMKGGEKRMYLPAFLENLVIYSPPRLT